MRIESHQKSHRQLVQRQGSTKVNGVRFAEQEGRVVSEPISETQVMSFMGVDGYSVLHDDLSFVKTTKQQERQRQGLAPALSQTPSGLIVPTAALAGEQERGEAFVAQQADPTNTKLPSDIRLDLERERRIKEADAAPQTPDEPAEDEDEEADMRQEDDLGPSAAEQAAYDTRPQTFKDAVDQSADEQPPAEEIEISPSQPVVSDPASGEGDVVVDDQGTLTHDQETKAVFGDSPGILDRIRLHEAGHERSRPLREIIAELEDDDDLSEEEYGIIQERKRALEAGETKTVTWAEVKAKMRAKLGDDASDEFVDPLPSETGEVSPASPSGGESGVSSYTSDEEVNAAIDDEHEAVMRERSAEPDAPRYDQMAYNDLRSLLKERGVKAGPSPKHEELVKLAFESHPQKGE